MPLESLSVEKRLLEVCPGTFESFFKSFFLQRKPGSATLENLALLKKHVFFFLKDKLRWIFGDPSKKFCHLVL